MAGRSEVLQPPDPELLEEIRQSHVREKFVQLVATVGLTAALYVNLMGGAIGGVLYGLGPLTSVSAGIALAAVPLLGLIGVNRYVQRHERAARDAIREVLGAGPKPGWASSVAVLGASGLMGLGIYLALEYDALRAGSLAFVGFAVVAPVLRKRNTPEIPTWALVALALWVASAGAWVWVFPDPHLGLNVGLVWLLLAPFGLPAILLRNRLVGWSAREDLLGRVSRALAVFLPTAQVARRMREGGDAEASLAALRYQFSRPLGRVLLFDTVLEVCETFTALGDPRTLDAYSALAHIAPADARPFVGLARALRADDPGRALAYARFAEENAVRTLSGGDPEVTALRESLERGEAVGDARE